MQVESSSCSGKGVVVLETRGPMIAADSTVVGSDKPRYYPPGKCLSPRFDIVDRPHATFCRGIGKETASKSAQAEQINMASCVAHEMIPPRLDFQPRGVQSQLGFILEDCSSSFGVNGTSQSRRAECTALIDNLVENAAIWVILRAACLSSDQITEKFQRKGVRISSNEKHTPVSIADRVGGGEIVENLIPLPSLVVIVRVSRTIKLILISDEI